MKNLANCTPTEFVTQTNLIRKSVDRWLTATDILGIRSRVPEFEVAKKDATPDERKAVAERNKQIESEAVKDKINAILNAILEEHPRETTELLALCCFVEPEDVDKHKMSEYLTSFNELINEESVIGFFISLMRLARMNTTGISKA